MALAADTTFVLLRSSLIVMTAASAATRSLSKLP
jgi:hypothetical protein